MCGGTCVITEINRSRMVLCSGVHCLSTVMSCLFSMKPICVCVCVCVCVHAGACVCVCACVCM